ncbi:recombinase family protein [Clostridium butyricum]|uniref:recombinase family protein n=1 Tax=Clostridium butyricum TaxID=1492 RepID=UPI00168BDBF0|nr:recombinase family protein [Clostridium butyricum]MDB2151155.1 recombinase family protein [Clostridium butyricum]
MIKIAIYSRKSVFTGKGESIENQIELCKNYCNTYVNSGSNLEYIIYEDEGFSGKNTNRPEFQHMIDDIKKKKIDTLICYRLDRISRNVADFSSTLELLQKYNVNFISIKERFDTSTPLGRAMIYIASVFAQLERETIAERVRDNMIQLAKSGRWLGGNIPYGFNIARKTYISDFKEKEFSILAPNKKELETVNFVYSYYIKTHSIRQVTRLLNVNSIIGKNGGSFDLTQIRRMLRNPLYVISDDKSHEYLIKKGLNVFGSPNGNGYITYNKSNQKNISADSNQWIVAVSNHKGIITSDNWLKVQHQLDNNKSKMPRIGTGKNHSLFSGILKCKKCGSNMIVKFSGKNKNNIPYEYYVCSGKQNKYLNKCTTKNIRVDKLDKILTRKLKIYNKTALMKTLRDSIDNTCCDFKSNQISSIEYEIQENKVSMDNLIKQLAKSASSAVSNRLMNEINLLDKNIVHLKKQLETIELEQSHDKKTNIDIKNIINVLNSFSATIEYIDDTAQKRFLIQTLIKSAVWDSDNNNVEIIFNTH